MPRVKRGEIWWADLNPTKGSEQRGHRPVLVISNDQLHRIPLGLLWILPLTTSEYGVPNHIEVAPPEAGIPKRSFVMCEQIRTITEGRLDDRIGELERGTLSEVDKKVRWLLGPSP